MAIKKNRDLELIADYKNFFAPLPGAVQEADNRAFEIYYGWHVAPPPPGVVIRSVTTTRSDEIAVGS